MRAARSSPGRAAARAARSASAAAAVEEGGRQPLAAPVEVAQIGEEILLGGVAAVVLHRVARAAVEERAQVDEGAQDLELGETGVGYRYRLRDRREALAVLRLD